MQQAHFFGVGVLAPLAGLIGFIGRWQIISDYFKSFARHKKNARYRR